MLLDKERVRQQLRDFDFTRLFAEELGWDRHTQTLELPIDGNTVSLSAVAHKRGLVAFKCGPGHDGRIPDYTTRRKIEKQVAKAVHEHLVIYTDAGQTTQVWEWVRREPGRPLACRAHEYHHTQPGDALIQKLQSIAFSLDEEEGLTLVDVTSRVRAEFDVEKVTKRFYDRFQKEHAAFHKFVKGIPDDWMHRWYTSVTLNRLMFTYFIEKKGFLNADPDYLLHKLQESKSRGKDLYFKDFLCTLFFEGFAKPKAARSDDTRALVGDVPYLNGGLFMPHRVEEECGDAIGIEDSAFERLFGFFEQYRWHLDERPLRKDNEINPDVLGYIFEKYINAIQPGEQKAKGAYYTKEDITEYISKNTVIPYLFDAARTECKIAFGEDGFVWRLAQADPDRYIHEPVRRGVIDPDGEVIPESELPDFVQVGMRDPKARMFDKRYNLTEADLRDKSGAKLTLPTETWREYVERRNRCLDLRAKLQAGEVHEINDFITYNMDIRQFAQDAIENCEGPELLRAFWKAIKGITVLDPACGSGAFLFAALSILEDLYEACLDRMQAFVDELERSGEKHHPQKFSDFREALEQVAQHPNRKYYVFKSIIVNNLYGVDIMEEAVEICMLRLFLKLVAQVDSADRIEPLPDIDFNIRAGNSLVGYATREEARQAAERELSGQGKMRFDDAFERIEAKAEDYDGLLEQFRMQQTEMGEEVSREDKDRLEAKRKELNDELNLYLAAEYGIDTKRDDALSKWRDSYKPFHWFIEFHPIMKSGGFDTVIGNPPYGELRALSDWGVRRFKTIPTKNIYPLMLERGAVLGKDTGWEGFIVPVSSVSTQGYSELQAILQQRSLHFSAYDDRPSRLFEGIEHSRMAIHILGPATTRGKSALLGTRYHKWNRGERPALFSCLAYEASGCALVEGSFLKLYSPVEHSILDRLQTERFPLFASSVQSSSNRIFYSRKVGYFLQVLDFTPEVRDQKGRLRPPSEFKPLYFPDDGVARCALCCLNSNLFYWFVTVLSDCRHLNKREVDAFPVRLRQLTDSPAGKTLFGLSALLSSDLSQHSELRTMKFAHDTLRVQCIIPRHSKQIIDKIDSTLAEHYGFTDEELDFIINYDIKYRMGLDEGEEEAQE